MVKYRGKGEEAVTKRDASDRIIVFENPIFNSQCGVHSAAKYRIALFNEKCELES